MEERECTKCGDSKPLKDFPIMKIPNGNEYYQHTCKKCRSTERVNRRKINEVRDRERNLAKLRYENNKQLVLDKSKAWRDTENGMKNRMLFRSLQRSKKKNYDYDITINDIVIPKLCPILQIPFNPGSRSGGYWDSPTIDRIDSTKGYTKDNIQIISMRANTMKSDANSEELVKFAKWILKTYDDDIVQTVHIDKSTESIG